MTTQLIKFSLAVTVLVLLCGCPKPEAIQYRATKLQFTPDDSVTAGLDVSQVTLEQFTRDGRIWLDLMLRNRGGKLTILLDKASIQVLDSEVPPEGVSFINQQDGIVTREESFQLKNKKARSVPVLSGLNSYRLSFKPKPVKFLKTYRAVVVLAGDPRRELEMIFHVIPAHYEKHREKFDNSP